MAAVNEPVVTVFLARQRGVPKAIFLMALRDAKALCSDPRSAGRTWMACWTATPFDAKDWTRDKGLLDGVIDDLCLKKVEQVAL